MICRLKTYIAYTFNQLFITIVLRVWRVSWLPYREKQAIITKINNFIDNYFIMKTLMPWLALVCCICYHGEFCSGCYLHIYIIILVWDIVLKDNDVAVPFMPYQYCIFAPICSTESVKGKCNELYSYIVPWFWCNWVSIELSSIYVSFYQCVSMSTFKDNDPLFFCSFLFKVILCTNQYVNTVTL